jgi:hypothetical protein
MGIALNPWLHFHLERDRTPDELLERTRMKPENVFAIKFAKLYPMYLKKAESKGRRRAEVEQVFHWLTGYDAAGLQRQVDRDVDLRAFFGEAPAMNPDRALIKGVVCGVRVEDVPDPLMRDIRYVDKLIDELAKGKAMEKILRTPL